MHVILWLIFNGQLSSPVLNKLFIQLNTPLPASAAAERLFSCADLTMSSRRIRMSIELFDNLVMLKVVMGGTEIFRGKVPRYSV